MNLSLTMIRFYQTRRNKDPIPAAARAFLRRGEGHGTFADLTVTAPRARPDAD